MTKTSKWTDQEKRTMEQNLHLKPEVTATVIPGKTTKQVSRMRSRILKSPPSGTQWARGIYNSLRSRRWTLTECSHYVNAVRGEIGSREFLKQRGLWYQA